MKLKENTFEFNHWEVESKWRKIWEKEALWQVNLDKTKKPFYNLMMFPYPSAEGLHVGNMYAFSGADIYGRLMRMQGKDVFEPIGLDGFGIHSENFAIQQGVHPSVMAKITQKKFYEQLKRIGNIFSWEQKLETYDPKYYQWTQWIFVKLFEAGLVERKKALVNWCPRCKTVLSDEQVINGICERCKARVEKKETKQWFFKITNYTERLLNNLKKIDWSEKTKIAQRNWIGKSEGVEIEYEVIGSGERIACFTTRPDTNFGATFVVLAPEYRLLKMSNVKCQMSNLKKVEDYIAKARQKSEIERIAEGRKKTGVFTGLYAKNLLTGRKMPIWVSDFVLPEVGTGAVVGVPAHDRRDFEFAKEFGLPIIRVVVSEDGDRSSVKKLKQVWEGEGRVINSGFLNGLATQKAKIKIMDYLEEKGWGRRKVVYRLRDWCVSRQRYWGPPIPMIYCKNCAQRGESWFTTENSKLKTQNSKLLTSERRMELAQTMEGWYCVDEADLPVLLPKIKDFMPDGSGKSPLARVPEFYQVSCPRCGREATRETDVSDTFLDSAWYFFRYTSTEFKDRPFDKPRVKKWLPVDMYIGGHEHACLHLMYTRFITMVFKDLGLIEFEEPFKRFYAHGLIIKEGAKMSKSKGNIVVPDEYLEKFGADALRCYLMFLGPYDMGGDFQDRGILGMRRFLERVWRLATDKMSKNIRSNEQLLTLMHQTVKKVTEDIQSLHYNTALARIMEYVNGLTEFMRGLNGLQKDIGSAKEYRPIERKGEEEAPKKNFSKDSSQHIRVLLLLLAPFAPYMTEELWQQLGYSAGRANKDWSIHSQSWPRFDPKFTKEKKATVVIQINGKLRERLKMTYEKSLVKKEVEEMAKKSEAGPKYLKDKKIKKVIFIPGKLINFVINEN
jgi:leucyl-tRNA synthetase